MAPNSVGVVLGMQPYMLGPETLSGAPSCVGRIFLGAQIWALSVDLWHGFRLSIPTC